MLFNKRRPRLVEQDKKRFSWRTCNQEGGGIDLSTLTVSMIILGHGDVSTAGKQQSVVKTRGLLDAWKELRRQNSGFQAWVGRC